MTDDRGNRYRTVTRSDPWLISGEAVVLVEGISGGYLCSRMEPGIDITLPHFKDRKKPYAIMLPDDYARRQACAAIEQAVLDLRTIPLHTVAPEAQALAADHLERILHTAQYTLPGGGQVQLYQGSK